MSGLAVLLWRVGSAQCQKGGFHPKIPTLATPRRVPKVGGLAGCCGNGGIEGMGSPLPLQPSSIPASHPAELLPLGSIPSMGRI